MLIGLGICILTHICRRLAYAKYYLITCPAWLLHRKYTACTDGLVTSWGTQCCFYVLSDWVEVNAEIKVWVVLCFYSIVLHRQVFVEPGSSVNVKSPSSSIHYMGDPHLAQLHFVTSNVPRRRTVGYIHLLHCNVGHKLLLVVQFVKAT